MMEAILNIVAALGVVGSITLLLWGMTLCLRHGLGEDAGPRRTAREDQWATGFARRMAAES
jgi:hypothetical protein